MLQKMTTSSLTLFSTFGAPSCFLLLLLQILEHHLKKQGLSKFTFPFIFGTTNFIQAYLGILERAIL